eukprot:s11981_g1.t1
MAALPSEAEQKAEVAKMDSDLQYVLQEASASLSTQYQVALRHQSRRRFQAIADDRAGARVAARDFGLDHNSAAGRVEIAAVVAAWELAKEFASKEIELRAEAKVESLQTSIDPTGHVRVTKTMQRLEMPHHSEGYRRLLKVEAHAWLCMSARFKAKAWLQGLQLDDFTKFVKEIELRAEAKVLGHKRVLQVQERQAMLKAVTDAYGKINEGETPSAEYLATKAEECESNEPLASPLDRISSKKDS